jgi:hypothetical protein
VIVEERLSPQCEIFGTRRTEAPMHDRQRLSSGSHFIELNKAVVEGVTWPAGRASLAALLDLGLSAQQIAHYFSVSSTEVVRVLRAFGMDDTAR